MLNVAGDRASSSSQLRNCGNAVMQPLCHWILAHRDADRTCMQQGSQGGAGAAPVNAVRVKTSSAAILTFFITFCSEDSTLRVPIFRSMTHGHFMPCNKLSRPMRSLLLPTSPW